MAETNGAQPIKEIAAMASKKLIAYLVLIAALMIFAFTGKIEPEGIGSILLTSTLGYWGIQGAVDLGKVVKDTIAKRNGNSGGSASPPA